MPFRRRRQRVEQPHLPAEEHVVLEHQPNGAPPAAMRAQTSRWLSKQAISAGRSPQLRRRRARPPAPPGRARRPPHPLERQAALGGDPADRGPALRRPARLMTWPITPPPPSRSRPAVQRPPRAPHLADPRLVRRGSSPGRHSRADGRDGPAARCSAGAGRARPAFFSRTPNSLSPPPYFIVSSKPLTFSASARNSEALAPQSARCTGVARSSAAITGCGNGMRLQPGPEPVDRPVRPQPAPVEDPPAATIVLVTAAVAAASSRIRLPVEKRSGPRQLQVAGDEVRVDQHVAVDEDQELRLRGGDRLVEDRRLLEARGPPARRGGSELRMRRGEGVDRRLGLRPRAVVGDADRVGQHRLRAPPRSGRASAPAGCRRSRRSARSRIGSHPIRAR